jgi:predicted cupin superfamily sugar epimerase
MVPRGALFGARIEGDGDYALVSCTVAPGFDFADFEMPARAELLARFPEHQGIIEALTHDDSGGGYTGSP